MKLYKKLHKIGTGYWLLIPQRVMREEELNDTSLIEVEIKKINSDKLIEYKCKSCEHNFCLTVEEEVYCSSCGEENKDCFEILDYEEDDNELIKEKLVNLSVKEFLSLINRETLKGGNLEND